MTENKGKLLIVKHTFRDHTEKLLSLQIRDNRLLHVQAEADSILGNIYVGKVQNVSKAVGACFVEIMPGQLCFLPCAEAEDKSCTLLLNRSWDGRILAGDEVLVQVVREAMRSKLPSVTTKISFSGKYVVLSAGQKHLGISGKIKEERKKELLTFLHEAGKIDEKKICVGDEIQGITHGFVVRTNAGTLTNDTYLLEEWQMLEEKWKGLLSHAKSRTCYSCMYEEMPTYLKNLRDIYDNGYDEILTDQPDIYARLETYFSENPAKNHAKLRLYQDEQISLSSLYGVPTKLETALGSRVWLKSGGYLVIETTEAMTVIDVNSGKYESKKDAPGGAAYKINLEAAQEIAFQLRLRNLSGIIVVDFINMKKNDSISLFKQLKYFCSQDAVPTDVVDITALGLVEITRKKINKTLKEQLKCNY